MKKNLLSADNAVKALLVRLFNVERVRYYHASISNGKHFLLRPVDRKVVAPSFFVLFKKDFFWSFSKQFEDFSRSNPSMSKVGESINLNILRLAIDFGVDLLLFVYRSGKVYSVNPRKLLKFVERENLIRSQDKLNKTTKGKVVETTASFPLSVLERWGDI